MAIARTDETDLLLPLHDGLHEQPYWATFLARLRRRTRAEQAGLVIDRADSPGRPGFAFFAGVRTPGLPRFSPAELYRIDPHRHATLRPGRVYAVDELTEPAKAHRDQPLGAYLAATGFADGRIARVSGRDGDGAWLLLAGPRGTFTGADSSLLASLVPHLQIVVRNMTRLRREHVRAQLGAELLDGAGIAWLAFDIDARIVDAHPRALRLLAAVTDQPRLVGERLQLPLAAAGRAIAQASSDFALDPDASARLVRLADHPVVDLLLRPARMSETGMLEREVAVGVLRVPPVAAAHAPSLAHALHVSNSEARLAAALADGRSLAEAAAALGLTLETARNYSKRLFAKTGTRGQAELVRRVLTSVATLG